MTSRRLKSILLVGLFLLISSMSYAEVLKFRTTSLAIRHEIDDYRWGEWSDFEAVSVLVVMDIDEDRITIYSQETQVYDVIESKSARYDSDGDQYVPFVCINEDGVKCLVEFGVLNSRNGQNQLFIQFGDIMFVYNMYALE